MSRYIDAEALIEAHYQYCNEHHGEADVFYGWSLELMKNAPSIDIVRCRECKHWKKIIGMVGECENDYMWSTLSGEITEVSSIDRNGDDFCSYGEREGE